MKVVISALDASIRVSAPDPIAALFHDLFEDLLDDRTDEPTDASDILWRPADSGRWHVSLAAGGSAITDVGGGLAESIIEINSQAARSVSSTQTVLHAGAFEVDGSAVAVTGVSGAGKSTLVAAAVLRGHGYLADEVCAVDPADYALRPYYRPIGLRPGGAAALGIPIPAHPLGAFTEVFPWRAGQHGSLAPAVPLRLLAFADRRPGPIELTRVGAADALVRLTKLSLGTDGFERQMFGRLDQLVREVPVVSIGYENSVEAIEALAGMIA